MSVAVVWSWPGWFPVTRGGHRGRPCDDCGLPHTRERRVAVLRRMLPATVGEVHEQWAHLWPPAARNGAGARLLLRDLHHIGATLRAGVWSLP